MSHVRNSLFLSVFAKNAELVIEFITTLIIARLLTPGEIGIYAIGAIFVGIALIVRNFGISEYVIQEKNLTKDKLGSAFGVSILISWSLALLVFFLAPYLGDFYNEVGVEKIMLILSLNFFLIPFGSIILAKLRREMQFSHLLLIRILGALVRSITVVSLAYYSFSYLSIAWGSVAGLIVTIIIANIYRPKDMPFLPNIKHIKGVLNFGGYASIANIVDESGRRSPDLIIGKVLDIASVGIYGRAVGLVEIFTKVIVQGIRPVILPHFSKLKREGKKKLDVEYCRSITYMTGVAWPFFIFLALMTFPVVRILYGDQWDLAIPIVKILCLYYVVEVLFWPVVEIMLSEGRVKRYALYQVLIQTVRILLVLLAVKEGLEAVAVAVVISGAIMFFIATYFIKNIVNVSILDIAKSIKQSFLLAILTGIAPVSVIYFIDIGPDNLWWPTIIAASGALLFWLIGVFLTNHLLKSELLILMDKLRLMRSK